MKRNRLLAQPLDPDALPFHSSFAASGQGLGWACRERFFFILAIVSCHLQKKWQDTLVGLIHCHFFSWVEPFESPATFPGNRKPQPTPWLFGPCLAASGCQDALSPGRPQRMSPLRMKAAHGPAGCGGWRVARP